VDADAHRQRPAPGDADAGDAVPVGARGAAPQPDRRAGQARPAVAVDDGDLEERAAGRDRRRGVLRRLPLDRRRRGRGGLMRGPAARRGEPGDGGDRRQADTGG